MHSGQAFPFPDPTATSGTAGPRRAGSCPLTCAKEEPA